MRLAYSVAEVAEMTGVPDSTVRDWLRDGVLAETRIGSRVLIHRDELVRVGLLRDTPVSERAQRIARSILAGR